MTSAVLLTENTSRQDGAKYSLEFRCNVGNI